MIETTTTTQPEPAAPNALDGAAATPCRPERPLWRQRLVDVERGMSHGLRRDSAFFVHFFLSSVVIVGSVVLGISLVQWTIVILALTLVLSAEMFNQVLKSLISSLGRHLDDSARSALRIGTAAVFVAAAGAMIVIALTLGQALIEMFNDV
jgi:undecaprenol kinase